MLKRVLLYICVGLIAGSYLYSFHVWQNTLALYDQNQIKVEKSARERKFLFSLLSRLELGARRILSDYGARISSVEDRVERLSKKGPVIINPKSIKKRP